MPFPTPILDRALADRRQYNEQQRLATCHLVLAWLDTVGRQYGIERAYLFGSLTRPNRFTECSDVDVAVESIDSESFFEAMAKLSEQVERDVDLVELSKCPFADRIRQQGIVWNQEI
jgi:predicted nucleotidyltransferase